MRHYNSDVTSSNFSITSLIFWSVRPSTESGDRLPCSHIGPALVASYGFSLVVPLITVSKFLNSGGLKQDNKRHSWRHVIPGMLYNINNLTVTTVNCRKSYHKPFRLQCKWNVSKCNKGFFVPSFRC